MKYVPTFMVLILIGGFIHGRFSSMNPRHQIDVDMKEPEISSPIVETHIEKPVDHLLFKMNEDVTCIYQGIHSWDNGDEFVKAIAIECTVVELMEGTEDMSEFHQSAFYQRFKVDCTEDIDLKSGHQGVSMVKDHKLNVKHFWTDTEKCYHFVTPKQ